MKPADEILHARIQLTGLESQALELIQSGADLLVLQELSVRIRATRHYLAHLEKDKKAIAELGPVIHEGHDSDAA